MERKQIKIKNIILGNGSVYVQSMTNTKTSNIQETVSQINLLKSAKCDIVRVSILDELDALALSEIKKQVSIPIVADIHFDYKLALLAIDNGADKIRINPGNIGSIDNVKKIVDKANERGIPIRIGVNSGSLEESTLNRLGNNYKALADSALYNVRLLENLGFYNIVVSAKSTNIEDTIKANEIIYNNCPYPIHIGLTETGPVEEGKIKSTLCISSLINKGIGDTIRVSLTADPVEEVDFAHKLLKTLGKEKGIRIISCPTCGRCQIDLIDIVNKVDNYTKRINKDLSIAIMGCVVNGPGEAKSCDFGVAGGKDNSVIFKNGTIIKTIENKDIYKELINIIEEA